MSGALEKYPELKELLQILRFEIQQAQRPSNEVILDDQDVMKMLKVSRRSIQYMKSNGILPYSRLGSRSYYLLKDVLDLIAEKRVEPIKTDLKIKLLS